MPADPELIAQLRPVRLPPEWQAFAWADVFAAIAIGVLAALVLLLVLRLATRRRETPLMVARRELAAASDLPGDERLFRQAALLDRLAGKRSRAAPAAIRAKIGEALYRPGGLADPDAVDAAILAFARSRRRSGLGT
ncbi:MAG TPA: hypothetical protein VGO17_09110 [Aurantimonas sp.]|jgi:hypothetical protein|nr:hypothetical protein [Aurantimonas sp.]